MRFCARTPQYQMKWTMANEREHGGTKRALADSGERSDHRRRSLASTYVSERRAGAVASCIISRLTVCDDQRPVRRRTLSHDASSRVRPYAMTSALSVVGEYWSHCHFLMNSWHRSWSFRTGGTRTHNLDIATCSPGSEDNHQPPAA